MTRLWGCLGGVHRALHRPGAGLVGLAWLEAWTWAWPWCVAGACGGGLWRRGVDGSDFMDFGYGLLFGPSLDMVWCAAIRGGFGRMGGVVACVW